MGIIIEEYNVGRKKMNDTIKNILAIENSKSYIAYNDYHKGNIFSITKTSRLEHTHSNFIAWLFDSKNNGTYPAWKFLNMLSVLKDNSINQNARCNYLYFEENDILDALSETEVSFKQGSRSRFVDIVVEVRTKDRIIPIIIENKVDSSEHDEQTKAYFEWGEKKYSDKNIYRDALYVFLFPDQKNLKAETQEYLNVTYQDLVDYVIEPTLWSTDIEKNKTIINMYLQCLSYQVENEKGGYSMALSSEERKILDNFIKENKNLLCAVINELSDDDVDPKVKDAMTNSVRDYSKYCLDNKDGLGKSGLVLAVVQKWVSENSPADFAALEAQFPAKLEGSKGVVRLLQNISDNDKGYNGKQKRYFLETKDLIQLPSGETAAVSTEWGRDNIENIINLATNQLGYNITKS